MYHSQRFSFVLNFEISFIYLRQEYKIRNINSLMFDLIDDKPEGVARGVYHV